MVDLGARSRALFAAALGTLLAGLGHLYLRRWRRAAGWFALGYLALVFVVPESALQAAVAGRVDTLALLPLWTLTALSAVDAYRLARGGRGDAVPGSRPALGDGPADARLECPACGRGTEPDLEFCHWCTTEFGAAGDDGGDGPARGTDGDA